MNKILFSLLIAFILINNGITQNVYKSEYGDDFPTKGTYRFLNIFVNIHYDEDSTVKWDPFFRGYDEYENPDFESTPWWEPAETCGINQSFPVYADSIFDLNYSQGNYTGILTRYFAEASFDSLILLGDYMSVDIPLSYFLDDSLHNIEEDEFQNDLFEYINENGGVQTTTYDSLTHYDVATLNTNQGIVKPMIPNDQIDYAVIWVRNSRLDSLIVGEISGSGGRGDLAFKGPIDLADGSFYIEQGAFFGSRGSLTQKILEPAFVHEFAHSLLGSNRWHTSGSNNCSGGVTHTFLHLQKGYGIIGWLGSSLVTVNGYERWRLGWDSPYGNGYPIQANGVNSDINKTQGPKSFILRDFITYGDAVRIKLPYVDSAAANQYIWLENHQVGSNNKLDFLTANYEQCRDYGAPGIYAYYQVGRDKIEGTVQDSVFPKYMADNLKMITAEGFWDMQKGPKGTPGCIASDSIAEVQYWLENPLNGAQDLMLHYFNDETNAIDNHNRYVLPSFLVRKEDNSVNKNLPSRGENVDAFTGTSVMDI